MASPFLKGPRSKRKPKRPLPYISVGTAARSIISFHVSAMRALVYSEYTDTVDPGAPEDRSVRDRFHVACQPWLLGCGSTRALQLYDHDDESDADTKGENRAIP